MFFIAVLLFIINSIESVFSYVFFFLLFDSLFCLYNIFKCKNICLV